MDSLLKAAMLFFLVIISLFVIYVVFRLGSYAILRSIHSIKKLISKEEKNAKTK